MSAITAKQVRDAAKGRVNENDLASVLVALGRYGDRFGLDRPHRLAQYFAQLMHESGDFPYDQEIWGADAGPAALRHAHRSRKHAGEGRRRAPLSRSDWYAAHRQVQLPPVSRRVPSGRPCLPGLCRGSRCRKHASLGRSRTAVLLGHARP